MTDDIRALTQRLAAEPGSLVFLELADALRRRGQFDAALAVVRGGLGRYPALAAAHDLLARIYSDRGEGDAAFDAWTEALRYDPRHTGALRGLAFLAFRAGDLARAERHLAAAVNLAPDDVGAAAALARVRQTRESGGPSPHGDAVETRDSPPEVDTLLVDAHGLRLSGSVARPDGTDVSDLLAGEVAQVAREAERATRLLELGPWSSLSVECADAQLYLLPPVAETILLARGRGEMPSGRLARAAEGAAQGARRWLERMQ